VPFTDLPLPARSTTAEAYYPGFPAVWFILSFPNQASIVFLFESIYNKDTDDHGGG